MKQLTIKKFIFLTLGLFVFFKCASGQNFITKNKPSEGTITKVVSFKGQQVTGVSVSQTGRIFVSFPQWRPDVKNSVVEVSRSKSQKPFPNQKWNSFPKSPVSDSVFLAVQSILAVDNELYVLDTRNPWFRGVMDAPRIFIFDLSTNQLKKVYIFQKDSFHKHSYINDLRVDKKQGKVYFTDSSIGGLVILDLSTGKTKRVLDNHPFTMADKDYLTINGQSLKIKVHSDGIALDETNNRLYFHALTGYNLYSIDTTILQSGTEAEIQKAVKLETKTSATDGMIFDQDERNLYLGDLENHKIMYLTPNKKLKTLAAGDQIRWADTFSIHNGSLYFTNSRLHEVGFGDVSNVSFTLNKIKLAD